MKALPDGNEYKIRHCRKNISDRENIRAEIIQNELEKKNFFF